MMMESMKNMTISRASTTKRNNTCPKKHFLSASYWSGWWNVLFPLLKMTEFYHGCFSLPFNLLISNPLNWSLPWSTISNEVSGHWWKLFLLREVRSKFYPMTDLTLGWRCPIHICWCGSCCIVPPLFNQEIPQEDVRFAHLRWFEKSQLEWTYIVGARNWYVAMMRPISSDVSLPFQMLYTMKSSMISGTGDLHLDKVYSSGWSVLDHPT